MALRRWYQAIVLALAIAHASGFLAPGRIARFSHLFSQASDPADDDEYLLAAQRSPLRQLKILFDCVQVNPEELSELLFECGVLSVSVEGLSEKPEVLNDESKWSDLQKTKSWATALLRANFPSSFDSAGLIDILAAAYPDTPFDVKEEDVVDKDWVTEVQQGWQPQVIDDLTVRFPWHEPSLVKTSKELILEGGAAFGTGDHPTTRLCLRWLSRIISQSNDNCDPLTICDYGCGSGILGLASLRFAKAGQSVTATGVDIDKDSLLSCRNNCEMNKLSMDLFIASDVDDEDNSLGSEAQSISKNTLRGGGEGAGEDFPNVSAIDDRQFDVIAANILAPILIFLAPSLAQRCKPGGQICLSGLVDKQSVAVTEAYSPFFSKVKVEEVEEGWVLITGTRREEAAETSDTWEQFLLDRQERSV